MKRHQTQGNLPQTKRNRPSSKAGTSDSSGRHLRGDGLHGDESRSSRRRTRRINKNSDNGQSTTTKHSDKRAADNGKQVVPNYRNLQKSADAEDLKNRSQKNSSDHQKSPEHIHQDPETVRDKTRQEEPLVVIDVRSNNRGKRKVDADKEKGHRDEVEYMNDEDYDELETEEEEGTEEEEVEGTGEEETEEGGSDKDDDYQDDMAEEGDSQEIIGMKSKRVSRIHENRSFLEKHGISTQQFEEAVSNIQSFILFDNAFPSNHEQYVEICELIRKFPHHRNTKDLMSKYNREISQTRGKSKEHIQEYLARIFPDREIDSSGKISDSNVKDSRAKALADLAVDDRFIWEPPEYQKNDDGVIQKGEDNKPIILKNARDPFTSPYIRNALRYLFLEGCAEWRKFSREEFTCPQLAFVCTLLYHICSDIKGSFSASKYRARYQNYLKRIVKRMNSGRLDLKDFYKKVASEVQVSGKSKVILDNTPDVVMDEDEKLDW